MNVFLPKSGQYVYGLMFAGISAIAFIGVMGGIAFFRYFPVFFYCFGQGQNCQAAGAIEAAKAVHIPLFSIFILGCLNFAISYLFGLVVSHKTFGPVVRIKRAVDSLISGDYGVHVVLRRGDQFKDLAEKINGLATTLQQKYGGSSKANTFETRNR